MNRPLRMLALSPVWAHGGTEVFHRTLSQYLDPTVIDFAGVLVYDELYRAFQLNPDHPLPVDWAPLDRLDELTQDADILMVWGGAYTPWLTRIPSRKIVFVCHGDNDWQQSILDGSHDVTDHVVFVSQWSRDHLLNVLPETVIYNGIETARLAQTRTREANRALMYITPDQFTVGCVARLSEEKRQSLLIETIATLDDHFQLVLAGEGQDKEALQEQAEEQASGQVCFVPIWDFAGDIYSTLDCHCLISKWEGYGLSHAEAIWSEVPTIATNVGIAHDFNIHGFNGLIVEPTVESLRNAILELEALPNNAKKMAARAKFTWPNQWLARQQAANYTRLFQRLHTESQG